jgi:hypothetical protein
MDAWEFVAMIFFGSILGSIAVYAVVCWVDRHNPFRETHRNINGRKRMATDWRKPQYLPKDWT